MNRRFPDWVFPRLTGAVAWTQFALVLSMILGLLLAAVPVFFIGLDDQESGGLPALTHRGSRLSLFLLGTATRTLLMSLAAIPAGILTAVYLAEYAPSGARATRILRWLVHGLAGVPSVIFGLLGLGFWISVVGVGLDRLAGDSAAPVWGRPGLLWASLTLAMMTLPVVVVSTEQALRSVPQQLRLAAMALGATRLQFVMQILLPNAWPSIASGVILTVGRAFGEVAPLLFTGAVMETQRSLAVDEPFMDLAHQVFVLGTRSAEHPSDRSLLLTCVWILVFLSLSFHAAAAVVRSRTLRAERDRP
jgi:phosphate transport system permease protein